MIYSKLVCIQNFNKKDEFIDACLSMTRLQRFLNSEKSKHKITKCKGIR